MNSQITEWENALILPNAPRDNTSDFELKMSVIVITAGTDFSGSVKKFLKKIYKYNVKTCSLHNNCIVLNDQIVSNLTEMLVGYIEVKDTYKVRPNIYIISGRTSCDHFHKTAEPIM